MNKTSLYLFGGALMASTALTSGSQAGTIKSSAASSSSITSVKLATEVFSATADTAKALTIGTTGGAGSTFVVDFTGSFTTGYNLTLNVTGATFKDTPTVAVHGQSTTGTLDAAQSLNGCVVQALPDKLLITGCSGTGTTIASRHDAMVISGITYTAANALAVAGQSIKVDGIVKSAIDSSVTFDTIASTAVVASKSAADAAITANLDFTLDGTLTPAYTVAFSKFVGAAQTAILGSIKYSMTGALGADLSNAFAVGSITSTSEVKIAHASLADQPALLSITVGDTTKTPGTYVSGTASFQLPAASLSGANITVVFDSTKSIAAAASKATDATVTPTKGTDTTNAIVVVPAFSGKLAGINRDGLSTEINTVLGIAGYSSFLRVANTSGNDSTATITVKNDTTGALLGSFTTAVPAGGTKQLTAGDIETAVPTAKAAGGIYKVNISGGFSGYVQHLALSPNGTLTDISGFRNGAATTKP